MSEKPLPQDRWEKKYNPKQEYDVDPYAYDTLYQYLDALRALWEKKYDPKGDYSSISPYDYYSEAEYKKAIKSDKKKDKWRDEHDYDYNFGVVPYDYDTKEEYLAAMKKEYEDLEPYLRLKDSINPAMNKDEFYEMIDEVKANLRKTIYSDMSDEEFEEMMEETDEEFEEMMEEIDEEFEEMMEEIENDE